MINVIKPDNSLPIKIWATNLEDGALEQAKNLSKLPFAFKHIALMADSHQGYGMPIGGVLATENVIIPNAIGLDISCGMNFLQTNIKYDNIKDIKDNKDKDIRKSWMSAVRKTIPLGFNHHKKKQKEWVPDNFIDNDMDNFLYEGDNIFTNEYQNSLYQLGTLGSGNHFIELQKDKNDYICIMIHSGSRNYGYKVAKFYNEKARELNKKWYSNTQKDLAFLPVNSEYGQRYIIEMKACMSFAKQSRHLMMKRAENALFNVLKKYGNINCSVLDNIDVHHNYARLENHFNKNVWVHRKGATSAKKDELGIIPGSQGTNSYIVKGLGNKESFMSCSHGAGRLMSRTKARNTLNLNDEINKLNDKDIIHSIRYQKDLDEASSSYKNIDVVMENQKDLVKIINKLTPLAVVKG